MNKISIDTALVQELIATQFPQWAHLPIRPVDAGGWDNRTFHLGNAMSVRLPSAAAYAAKVPIEQYWLPKLAPYLPLPIPTPVAMGKPSTTYPWHWSVYTWLNGAAASLERIDNMPQFATTLAHFLVALQHIDPTGGPAAGPHNFYRGGPLKTYDAETRQAISALSNTIDAEIITAIWDAAVATSWQKTPVWVHGDVAPGNLLVEHGQLSAVIDFGGLGIGDPACDMAIAWTFFKKESREAFRAALHTNTDTWKRGRGWALWKALIICAKQADTDASKIELSQQVIDEIVADCTRSPMHEF
jgi:aminoglycoside phosphotransferase (APT) family kinase protein